MGFPQGGICSATFWSLAFDEVVRLINNEDTLGVAFADDCGVLSGGPDPALLVSQVQHTVDWLVTWGSECGLTFNPIKTQVVFFTRTRTIPPHAITVSGHPVPYSTTAQYLGLTLHQRLWWHDHVLRKTTKAKCLLNALLSATRGNWGPRPDITKWIYTAIVRPSLSYASVIWAHDVSLQKTTRCLDALDRLVLRSLTHDDFLLFFLSLAFPSALMLGTEGDLPGIVTWRAFTTPGTGAPITGPP